MDRTRQLFFDAEARTGWSYHLKEPNQFEEPRPERVFCFKVCSEEGAEAKFQMRGSPSEQAETLVQSAACERRNRAEDALDWKARNALKTRDLHTEQLFGDSALL